MGIGGLGGIGGFQGKKGSEPLRRNWRELRRNTKFHFPELAVEDQWLELALRRNWKLAVGSWQLAVGSSWPLAVGIWQGICLFP